MGFFSKLANSLKKTKEKISSTFARVFSIDRIGEEFYDELLDALVSSDISVRTAMDIVDNLRDEMIEDSVKDKEEVVETLKEILTQKDIELMGFKNQIRYLNLSKVEIDILNA